VRISLDLHPRPGCTAPGDSSVALVEIYLIESGRWPVSSRAPNKASGTSLERDGGMLSVHNGAQPT